jgi:hypothetical protein
MSITTIQYTLQLQNLFIDFNAYSERSIIFSEKEELLEQSIRFLDWNKVANLLSLDEIKTEEVYGDIEHLILIDRNIDFVTPLLKQMTYEGLIDECYGI